MQEFSKSELGLLGLSHISLSTVNLEKAESFYIDVLGGQKVFDLTNVATGVRYGAFIAMGNGTFIEIFNYADLRASSPSQCISAYRHICFQVRSIKVAADFLAQFGYEPTIKVGRVDRVPQFFISGPDGVEIEFHEYCDDSLQRPYVSHER